ncbi:MULTISPECIES: YciI family protein [unclassified Microbacterium]|uniref:YciI family protein n=1 Tax=unclassified Microbacterium TaxID=2609290 RepID=UPI000CFDC8BF|nr:MULTISPECIES: YciI family protein [unclassified Microbacterium]PQZ53484.1 hypothetical protein CQ032_15065 [Microbacterium sp. MYb43]PQZ75087.1 hypothetical protein CQ031_14420 [Microbacterium sp. MYb40]PRB19381.1 hypothetical protein CQ040_15715 [Microbacterium sp. MYb54]PRB24582.1 hypothetical protein CQ037_16220 [Microbacterium sp. MYb50]PRB63693.1 hypothetical protein CQ021_15825 [Microbacterium sp. MYb24]
MYVITLDYLAPADAVDAALEAHNEWLNVHYTRGLFLISGPREPRVGGVIITADRPRDEVEAAIIRDPFALRGIARHSLIEFRPSRVARLKAWPIRE